MANIMVIDDSQATVNMLANILQSASHDVTGYTNPQGVEDKVAATSPNLVLLDIVMPERNGYEVMRALKRNSATRNIPVLLVSSKGQETDIKWGMRQGAADYVVKPFSPDDVLTKVSSLL